VKFSNPTNLFKSGKKDNKNSDTKKPKITKEAVVKEETERKLFGLFHIKSNKQLVIIGVVAAVVLWLAITAVGLYAFRWENQYAETMTRYIPYPIATVNGQIIYYYPYLENVNILKKYESEFKNVKFNTTAGKKIAQSIRSDTMNSLVEDVIIKKEAKKIKDTVTQKELDASYAQLIKSNGGEKSFTDVLSKYYGLTPQQFEYDIYKDRLLRQKLTDNFASDANINQDALKLAQKVLAKVKAGGDFSTLAKQYSQDSTASSGGDLGYFSKGKMVPEFEQVAFALKIGETSGIVKTVYGYDIIKVTDIKGDQIHAYHILIKTKDFQTWLDDSVKSAKKHYLISI
jgi:foldase protein PrsA